MQFDWRQAIGKSGERKVEAFIEDELESTYRKVGPPDIGVDGEIEIADASRKSTGGLLKIQVKATQESLGGQSSIRIAFDEDHLDYFASLMVQPILTVVSLADNAIWWKPILHKDHYRGPKGGFGVTLHSKIDRLTRASAPLLKMLGERSNATIARYILEEAEDHLTSMDDQLSSENFDYVTAQVWGQTLASVQRTLRDAKCLLRYERRYSAEITKVEARSEEVADRVAIWRKWFKEYEMQELLTNHAGDDI
jgi:hypothetical protein